jgi:hypothetical protein
MSIFEFDTLPYLEQTSGWDTILRKVCDENSFERTFNPAAPTAREENIGAPIRSRVVEGLVIQERLPWLVALYSGAFLDIAARATGRTVITSPLCISAININIIAGRGGRLERHVDTNHLTGLLFANDLDESHGGRLVIDDQTSRIKINPKCGKLLLFDGREAPHYVEPLAEDVSRITVVMNYYYADEPILRPADLDQYLYGKAAMRKVD